MKRIIITKLFILFSFFSGIKVFAQDALYTQFFYMPANVNPAFAGTGKNNLRLTAASKFQWFNLYKPFKYYYGGADMSIYNYNQRNVLNLGINVNHSRKGYLNNTNVAAIVGRSFGTNNENCSNWFLSLALQAGLAFARVNPDEFIFSDQLDQTGITGNSSQVDLFATYNSKNYFDFGAGFLFTYADFMIGASAYHLNEPNVSFVGTPEDGKLPKKITGHFSYRYDAEVITLKPTLIAQVQGKSSMYTIGTLIDYFEFPIEFGLWYRNAVGLSNNSAFSVSVSVKWGEISTVTSRTKEYANKLGLSYDADINKPALNTTHGSLELGLQRDIIINDNNYCPTSSSGICNYRFPWEFF